MDKTGNFQISVYLDNGTVYEYLVEGSEDKAREHASEIISGGYRHTVGDTMEWFPQHRIRKVKVVSEHTISTNYPDQVRGT